MADELLGDLIVGLKIDDAKYRQQVKSALTTTVAQAKAASAQTSTALSKGFDTAQAVQGLRALQGSLYLVTGQTGFMVLEAGRTAVALSKMAQASGGVVAALSAAGTGAIAFVSKLNPVVLAIGGLTAAYFALRNATGGAKEQHKEFLKTLQDIRSETEKLGASESDLRAMRERDAAKKLPFGGAMPGGHVNPSMAAYAAAEDTLESKRADVAIRNQVEVARKRREETRRSLLIDLGLGSASDFENDNATRQFLKLGERAAMLRKQAAEAGISSFGIGTVNSSAFRFGSGATGSVIGQQTEQAKTNKLLEEVNATLKQEFRALITKLAAEAPYASLGPI